VSNILNELLLSLAIDSNFAFIYADFATVCLKIAKYINTVQIPAIAVVECASLPMLFLYHQKQIAMLQQNIASNQVAANALSTTAGVNNNCNTKTNHHKTISCNQRNENG
jgi:hypothetical protein